MKISLEDILNEIVDEVTQKDLLTENKDEDKESDDKENKEKESDDKESDNKEESNEKECECDSKDSSIPSVIASKAIPTSLAAGAGALGLRKKFHQHFGE